MRKRPNRNCVHPHARRWRIEPEEAEKLRRLYRLRKREKLKGRGRVTYYEYLDPAHYFFIKAAFAKVENVRSEK